MNMYVGRRVSEIRAIFSNETTEQLKQYFEKNQYVTKAMFNEIQANLGLDKKHLRKWFSNRRQRIKKEKGCWKHSRQ